MRNVTVAALLAALAVFSFWPHKTGPTEVGVRTIKWSPFAPKGVMSQVYPPGATYFFPAVLNDFIHSGLEFGGQATAAVKAADKGTAYQGAVSLSPGVWLYQLTDKGLALELTAKGTKYYKDGDLG